MLVQIKGSRLFARFFSEFVAKSKTNACPNQGLKTLWWFFFLEVIDRSKTNVCLDQVFKTFCYFFFQKLLLSR